MNRAGPAQGWIFSPLASISTNCAMRFARVSAFFATLDSRNRYAVLFRTQGAKRPETRAKRIAQFVEMLAKGEKIHP